MGAVLIYLPLAVGFAETGRLRWVGPTSGDLMSASSAWIETEITDGMICPLTQREPRFVEWPLAFEHRGDETTFVLTVPFSGAPLFDVDAAGRLWYTQTGNPLIHRWSIDGELSARRPHVVQRTIDIYDAQGTPVAIAYATLEADPKPRVRHGLLAAIIRDELDVESVVLYRIGQ
jgi:hypothetical protein